ncbi:unnamed protein product [Urochloa humidicola]
MIMVGNRRVVALVAAVVSTTLLLPPPSFGDAAPAAAATLFPNISSCTRRCGSVSIPNPFGVEPGCYHAAGGFNLTCNQQLENPPKLFLGDGTVQVLEISVPHNTVRINSTRVDFPDDDANGITPNRTWGDSLPQRGPYFLSESVSMVQAIGCGIQPCRRRRRRSRPPAAALAHVLCSSPCTSVPLHCTTRRLPRRAASAIDASGRRRRLTGRRKPVGPFSPTSVATLFVFLAGGRSLAPSHAGGPALLLLPRRRSHAKDQGSSS